MATKGNTRLIASNTGTGSLSGACVVIVKTDWNAVIVDELESGVIRALKLREISKIVTITVPGAIEIAFGIKTYWNATKYKDDRPDTFIALGTVIQGDTPHFEYVCQSVTQGITLLNQELPVPTIFGVLTVNNEQQALDRIGGIHGHKGEEAGLTAIKMIELISQIKARR
jgi:6,7-dimethyl-8-ribityllumazine synthase